MAYVPPQKLDKPKLATETRSESTAIKATVDASAAPVTITLRDHFFMAALTTLAPWAPHHQDADVVRRAWNIVDEAMKQRRA